MKLRETTRTFVALLSLSIFCSACQSDAPLPLTNESSVSAAGSSNGAAGQMPAYYDHQLFTVNMKQLPDGASAATIANNKSINTIYASNDLDGEQQFVPVLDAIQGDGFNPLWQQVLIVFNPGFTPLPVLLG
jgi:hypothetical protein